MLRTHGFCALGETSRTFSAIYLEGISSGFPELTINFSLICNQIIVDVANTRLSCGGGAPAINIGPAEIPSSYISTDDSVFELTLTEYYTEDGNCGCTPYPVTFKFTKQ